VGTTSIGFKYAESTPVEGPLETPCLRWSGHFNGGGYGCFRCEGKEHLAHRIAWLIFKGEEISDELCICHACDNPWCVRIEHLFIGTHLDNMQDRDAKGRNRPSLGEDNGFAHLTADQVRQIYRLSWDGRYLQQGIANAFGVSRRTVEFIKYRRIWKHLWAEEPEEPTSLPEEISIPEKRQPSSRFKGVTAASRGRWKAYAGQVSLGLFTSEEDAARARNQWDAANGRPPSNWLPPVLEEITPQQWEAMQCSGEWKDVVVGRAC
jgi:hypothetical protein